MRPYEQLRKEEKLKKKQRRKKYTHLNTEFQRIARRDKKAFLSDQHKEIDENNRMGKPRDLFKKIRDNKGTFHAKMSTVKDQTEAEDIKKLRRHGKNTQKNDTIKIFMIQIATWCDH